MKLALIITQSMHLDHNVTRKQYSDEGYCATSDLKLPIDPPLPTYSCEEGDDGFYHTLDCQKTDPQGTKGYIYDQFYSKTGCLGSRTFAQGHYADHCYAGSSGTYYKYHFTQRKSDAWLQHR